MRVRTSPTLDIPSGRHCSNVKKLPSPKSVLLESHFNVYVAVARSNVRGGDVPGGDCPDPCNTTSVWWWFQRNFARRRSNWSTDAALTQFLLTSTGRMDGRTVGGWGGGGWFRWVSGRWVGRGFSGREGRGRDQSADGGLVCLLAERHVASRGQMRTWRRWPGPDRLAARSDTVGRALLASTWEVWQSEWRVCCVHCALFDSRPRWFCPLPCLTGWKQAGIVRLYYIAVCITRLAADTDIQGYIHPDFGRAVHIHGKSVDMDMGE